MRVGSVILFLAAAAGASTAAGDASSGAPASDSLIGRAHRAAVRHSAGLARDLRVAFRGVLRERRDTSSPLANQRIMAAQKPYCVSGQPGTSPANPGVVHNGTTSASGPKSTTATRSTTRTASATTTQGGATPTASSAWQIWKDYSGSTFFDEWDFTVGGDPTNGIVNYIDEGSARSANLASVNNAGNVVMSIDTTPTVANLRNSVRITTQATFNGGIVVLDAVHMPTGCGTWPAFWTNGPNWPYQGEIDIVEGVNDYIANQATIHTDTGCTITSNAQALNISGTLVAQTNCAAYATGNQGCGMRASDLKSFGAAFNANGGGTYAMVWDTTGVAIYFWESGTVPADLSAGTPVPEGWAAPMARWPASTCDPFKFFKGHSVIVDTTLCGDWASSAWTTSGVPGQDTSCAQRTGVSTCEAFVRANGAAFSQAYWEIRSVKIYQLKN